MGRLPESPVHVLYMKLLQAQFLFGSVIGLELAARLLISLYERRGSAGLPVRHHRPSAA
jgi:hypothetical protein